MKISEKIKFDASQAVLTHTADACRKWLNTHNGAKYSQSGLTSLR